LTEIQVMGFLVPTFDVLL